MAIVAADKIFVDVNDEINFVVEKFLASSSDQVILVCPQNALIVSSHVSIKILVKQMLKSKRLLVIVTEDEFGQRIAESAGLVVASKVSQISSDVWAKAALLKEELQRVMHARKQELLQERGIIEKEPAHETQTVIESEQPIVEEIVEADEPEVEATEAEEQVETEVEQEVVEDAEVEAQEQAEAEAETEVADEEDEPANLVGAIQRKRPEAKVVNLGNLKIMGGGDITKVKKNDTGDTEMAKKNATNRLEEAEPNSQFKGGFTGRDWTKYTQKEKRNIVERLRDAMPSFGGEQNRAASIAEAASKKRRLIIAGSIGFILFLALISYLVLFVFSSVDIDVTLVKTEVPVEQKINIDANLPEDALTAESGESITPVEDEEITIPAILISDDSLSISETAEATGTRRRGDKAAGLIQLWNKKEEEVTIPAGTVLTSAVNDRKYIVADEITLPAASEDSGGVTDFGIVDDVRIDANKIGEEFNLSADATLDFSVAGYSSEEVVGKGFNDIPGGTSEEYQAVSEKDIEDLTKKLREQLLQEGTELLTTQVPNGYRLIAGTERLVDVEASSDPTAGNQTENFTLTVEATINALAVKEEDLSIAIQFLILNSQDEDGGFDVTGLEDAVITEVQREGRKASFLVTSQGSLQSAITVEELREALVGQSVVAAREYLSQFDDIERYSVVYSPGFVPDAFQRVPRDEGRVSIRIR